MLGVRPGTRGVSIRASGRGDSPASMAGEVFPGNRPGVPGHFPPLGGPVGRASGPALLRAIPVGGHLGQVVEHRVVIRHAHGVPGGVGRAVFGIDDGAEVRDVGQDPGAEACGVAGTLAGRGRVEEDD
jgi:hypothetical protein